MAERLGGFTTDENVGSHWERIARNSSWYAPSSSSRSRGLPPKPLSISSKLITIDHTQVSGSSNLLDFPVLVSFVDPDLKTVGNGGGVENASGFDIVFRAADGVTSLDYEVEHYDPLAGTLVAWVRIPLLDHDDDTLFYIYYGDSTIVSSQDRSVSLEPAGVIADALEATLLE